MEEFVFHTAQYIAEKLFGKSKLNSSQENTIVATNEETDNVATKSAELTTSEEPSTSAEKLIQEKDFEIVEENDKDQIEAEDDVEEGEDEEDDVEEEDEEKNGLLQKINEDLDTFGGNNVFHLCFFHIKEKFLCSLCSNIA